LVGESGCGKTTVGKLLVKLLEPTSGEVLFRLPGLAPEVGPADSPVSVTAITSRRVRAFRRQAQMIFQDPYESMNPRRTIYDTIAEPLAVQGIGTVMDRVDRVSEILMLVGLTPPATFLFRHPHELSGGQRQRVAIARALVVEPSLVVADEPTSMLDVSSRTGIMNLMQQLAHGLGIAYLYVTHDLAVARYMCQRIAVMYLGKIVEIGETEGLLRNPLHPYTRALLSAIPVPDPQYRREPPNLRGDLSAPIDPPARCRFYDRCPLATDHCRDNPHPPTEEKGPDHWVACYEV
jgi:peptide/nickel transport system ATP-binding protein